MSFSRRTSRLLSLGALCGGAMLSCSTALARDVPAVIVQSTEQSHLVLQQVVSGALKRETVLLANDALTQSSTLTIEPARVRDGQGQVIYDREVRTLERFYLVRSWWRCILIRENTGERFKLSQTKCVAKP